MEKTVWKDEKKSGLVVGNSTISCAISPSGRMYQRILYNPPQFTGGRNGLREAGSCGFAFRVGGTVKTDASLLWNVEEKMFPRYKAKASVTENLEASVFSFAPLSVDDVEFTFAPAVITEFVFHNDDDKAVTLDVSLEWQSTYKALRESFALGCELKQPAQNHYLLKKGNAFVSAFGDVTSAEWEEDAESGAFLLAPTVYIPAKGSARVVFLLGIFDDQHRYHMRFFNAEEVVCYLQQSFSALKDGVDDFIRCVPNIGDEKIYQYTRWYLQAAVLLTKSAVTGEVITMGYNELNQRDSFWTSFLHVSAWSSLEREMIRISCRWQSDNGKIPTTILPRIERYFDLDINEYFCLRIARYFKYHRDYCFLEETFDAFKKSVDYILAQDTDGDMLPEQTPPSNPDCFWADWKDVSGIIGRKLIPHVCLLWLAVLKEGIDLANAMNDTKTAEKYRAIYDTAYVNINKDVADGGLWKNDHYAEVWYDNREMNEILEDQTVGLLYDVVPQERIPLIYQALSGSENEFGVRETYPYRPDFGYSEGDYHNGGIWPFLMFCDIMGRYRRGYAEDAERLIKKIGYYDLEVPGDFAPNEYLQGDTGENMGKEIQGWSSALYGVITHGAFEISFTSDTEINIQVNFRNRDFETVLILPKRFGRIKLARRGGVLVHSTPSDSRFTVTVSE